MLRSLNVLLFLLALPLAPLAAEPIDLLAAPLAETFVQHLNEKGSLETDFDAVWQKTEDGSLRIPGKGLGYLRTKDSFENYHLVVEYRWTEYTFAGRADRARDGGVLFHITGEDGAFGGTWPACLQAQLLEGGSGDLVCLPTEAVAATFTAKASMQDPPLWTPDGKSYSFPRPGKKTGQLGWKDRSENWKNEQGFRGELDIENPVGEWNRLEVIAQGDTVEIYLNGELVNKAASVFPASGRIGFQTELASYEVRRAEVFDAGSFKEVWTAESKSTDMGYAITGESILPRALPLSPEESAKAWQLDGDFTIELVAAEPLTRDPVDIVWDEKGRLFVAEMGDYPLPSEGGPYLSRIRLLLDESGDGRMDKAVTWADELDHVQGLLPMRGGLLATTRTAILFLKDTDGDNRADVREVLFRSNEPRHNQLQVSSPRCGLDNHIYLSNGLDGKEIYPEGDPDAVVSFPRLNLRYDPQSGAIKPATGIGQYGGTLDAFGRHFFCSNRNPAMFAVMPLEAVTRNPLAGIAQGHEDIQAPGAPLHPLLLSHTTSSAHAGTHTAACGLVAYTGDLMPDLAGDLFVCDPTAQLVTRNRMIPNGASFKAERVGERKEFLASSDEWVRPVQARNGPDGALYIVDMYRRFIDHSRFFPEDFAKSHYMRAGLDQGRIWRIVPKGSEVRPVKPLPDDLPSLVATLDHPNAWDRTHAQRLLVERADDEAVHLLEALIAENPSPVGVSHAFRTLQGLGKLTPATLHSVESSDPGLLENKLFAINELGWQSKFGDFIHASQKADDPRTRFLAVALFPSQKPEVTDLAKRVADKPMDTWFRKAIFSASPELVPELLVALLTDENFLKASGKTGPEALTDMARLVTASGPLDALSPIIAALSEDPQWWHFAVVSGISEGLPRSSLKTKTLAALMTSPPEGFAEDAASLKAIVASASGIALDTKRPEADRIIALSLVAQLPWEAKIEIVDQLIAAIESPGIHTAACRTLTRDNREKVAEFFFERWTRLSPTPLREALALITGNPKSGLALMKRMKAGEISPSLMPPMTRWSYGRSTDEELKNLANELFGAASGNRNEVVTRYRDAQESHTGDPAKGQVIFERATCALCHQVGGKGIAVGPSLDDVKIKPAEALLSDILDPNRAIEERWISVSVTAKDGRILSGLIHAEDSDSVTLRLPGGIEETIIRADIAEMTSSGYSLMPEGLEAAITTEEMADLLAFLKNG